MAPGWVGGGRPEDRRAGSRGCRAALLGRVLARGRPVDSRVHLPSPGAGQATWRHALAVLASLPRGRLGRACHSAGPASCALSHGPCFRRAQGRQQEEAAEAEERVEEEEAGRRAPLGGVRAAAPAPHGPQTQPTAHQPGAGGAVPGAHLPAVPAPPPGPAPCPPGGAVDARSVWLQRRDRRGQSGQHPSPPSDSSSWWCSLES